MPADERSRRTGPRWLRKACAGILAAVLIFSAFTCDTTEPPPPPPPPPPAYHPTIELAVVDSGLTDVVLRVRHVDTTFSRVVRLVRDGSRLVFQAVVYGDTLVRDSGLSLHSTMSYQAFSVRDSFTADSSASVRVRTLDTTRSEFLFTTDVIGTSGVFFDVAVLAHDNIWAVGEFYSPDSANPVAYYNAAHWDGVAWNVLKVPTWSGPLQVTSGLRTIMAYAPREIWVSSPSNLLRFNGIAWTSMANFFRSDPYLNPIQDMWGDEERRFALVGGYGTVFQYNNGSWALLPAVTDVELMTVCGGRNALTGLVEILAVGSDRQSGRTVLLEITPSGASVLPIDGIVLSYLWGCWLSAGRRYWLATGGLYGKIGSYREGRWQRVQGIPARAYDDVKGDAENNVFAVGYPATILHFNGSTWHDLSGGITTPSAVLWGVDGRGDAMAAVGSYENRALVIRGRRVR